MQESHILISGAGEFSPGGYIAVLFSFHYFEKPMWGSTISGPTLNIVVCLAITDMKSVIIY